MKSSVLQYFGTVLLVEDLDDSRFMLRRLLELEGFDVIEAKDGAWYDFYKQEMFTIWEHCTDWNCKNAR